jgi:hypothetical protein
VDKRAAEQYLDKMYGDRQGYVAVAYKDKGQSWQEHQFAWPTERGKLLGWAEIHHDANVFICPALRKDAHTRKKGDMQPTRWLWADVDMQAIIQPEIREQVNQRIRDIGTYVVASGSGDNAHVYVELTAPVEHAEFIKLNTGLRDYLYADAKQADNSLLRLSGTTNWKTPEGSPVRDTERGNGRKKAAANLMKLRPFRDAKVIQDAEATEWTFTEVEGLPRRIKAKVNMPVEEAVARYHTRHEAVWAITGDLHKAGMGADEIHSLMDKFPPALSKAADENGYDVHQDVDKRLLYDRTHIVSTVEDDDDVSGEVFESMTVEEMTESVVAEGVAKELLRRDIRRAADMLEATRGHTEPPADTSYSLSDALALPPAPVQYLIDGLASATANVVITGQYKSGKTHLMVATLITALADNEPFLGAKEVHVPEGGAVVGHWNLEMSALDLIDKYMRPAGYKNTHNVHLANWQGYRLNIMTVPGKQAAVEWLKSRGVQVWTIDSWSALCRMCGVDPNDNKEVSDLLGQINEIKVESGVQATFMLAHTARSSAESDKPGTRGASALDEGVDTRWMFTVDKSDVRFLQAEGRGTQMNAVSLDFNEETGRSVIGSTTKAGAAADGWVQTIVAILRDMTGRGLNESTLVKKMREVKPVGVSKAKDYVKEAIDDGWVEIKEEVRPGGGRAMKMHYLANMQAPEGDRNMKATPREINLAAVRGNGRRRAST